MNIANEIKMIRELLGLSQQELADMAHISKYKANQFINELINDDCVCLYQNKRGKYKLTEKGTKIVQEMQRKRN